MTVSTRSYRKKSVRKSPLVFLLRVDCSITPCAVLRSSQGSELATPYGFLSHVVL